MVAMIVHKYAETEEPRASGSAVQAPLRAPEWAMEGSTRSRRVRKDEGSGGELRRKLTRSEVAAEASAARRSPLLRRACASAAHVVDKVEVAIPDANAIAVAQLLPFDWLVVNEAAVRAVHVEQRDVLCANE